MSATRHVLNPFARRVTYRLQTHDVRSFALEDAVRRARAAVSRAGGELLGGVSAPPRHTKRWCVNRSPHVNKTSREHFWMITHRRIFEWDAGAAVEREAPAFIAGNLPAHVAVRVTENMPAIMALPLAWQTMHKARGGSSAVDGTEAVLNTGAEHSAKTTDAKTTSSATEDTVQAPGSADS